MVKSRGGVYNQKKYGHVDEQYGLLVLKPLDLEWFRDMCILKLVCEARGWTISWLVEGAWNSLRLCGISQLLQVAIDHILDQPK
jgi:hypothetical protein